MAEFKLTLNDPKTGKSYKKEIKDKEADVFLNLKIRDKVDGDSFGFNGYQFEITGGSDFCGFPMRSGIQTPRKQIVIGKSVGLRDAEKGFRRKKTVCGQKIIEKISQINLKIIKHGEKPLEEPKAEKEAPKEDAGKSTK